MQMKFQLQKHKKSEYEEFDPLSLSCEGSPS